MGKMRHNLILFGFKSSGKTHFGQLLSAEIGFHWIDTDLLIEAAYCEEFQATLTCRQIALTHGDPIFRTYEHRVIEKIIIDHHVVISLGGGAVLNEHNRDKLSHIGRFVYLEVDQMTLKNSLFSKELPSYLDANDLERSFEKMYQERLAVYNQIDAVRVSTHGKTERDILDELIHLTYHTDRCWLNAGHYLSIR